MVLGKGTAGAFGACGATLPILYKGHNREMLTPGHWVISPGGLRPPARRNPDLQPSLRDLNPGLKTRPWAP